MIFLTVFEDMLKPSNSPRRFVAKRYRDNNQTDWTLANNPNARKVFTVNGEDSSVVTAEAKQKARDEAIFWVENLDEV